MAMETDVTVNAYLSVAPYPDIHGHGPVTGIGPAGEGAEVFACLDCGFVDAEVNGFGNAECDREKNGANSTWRERLEEYGMAALDTRSGDLEEGEGHLTVGGLMDIAWEQYQDFYENPRAIGYFEIESIVGVPNIRALDYVAAAIDLACDDAHDGLDMRDRGEVFEHVGHPSDPQWDLVVGSDE